MTDHRKSTKTQEVSGFLCVQSTNLPQCRKKYTEMTGKTSRVQNQHILTHTRVHTYTHTHTHMKWCDCNTANVYNKSNNSTTMQYKSGQQGRGYIETSRVQNRHTHSHTHTHTNTHTHRHTYTNIHIQMNWYGYKHIAITTQKNEIRGGNQIRHRMIKLY